jgi:hypothetical protein
MRIEKANVKRGMIIHGGECWAPLAAERGRASPAPPRNGAARPPPSLAAIAERLDLVKRKLDEIAQWARTKRR